jgi:hypothetical protein
MLLGVPEQVFRLKSSTGNSRQIASRRAESKSSLQAAAQTERIADPTAAFGNAANKRPL